VYLVPFAKYPPNPPAVGDPDTIDERTLLYVTILAWAIAAAWIAARVGTWLREREVADPGRLSAVAGAFVVLVGIGYVVLPGSPDAVSAPATLIWQFRLASAGGALAMWAVTGVAFGWLSVAAARRTARIRQEVPTG
jgi:Probable cobalt transporter subunit (CbtA)